jgi:site-specific DNA recombinase
VGHGCPGAPGQAGDHPPGPGPAGAPTPAAAGRLPGRGGGLAELEHKRQELDRRRATLATQQRQLDAIAEQRLELRAIADGIQAFCQTVRAGLATATFAQRRLLVELLIDRVVVTDDKVEIRYVLPTSPDGPHPPFCQLRKDHLDAPSRMHL